jgi:hypothetical protein
MTAIPAFYNPVSVTYTDGDGEHNAVVIQSSFDPITGQVHGRLLQRITDWRVQANQRPLAVNADHLIAIEVFIGSAEELEAINAPLFGQAVTPPTTDGDEAMVIGQNYRLTLANGTTMEIRVEGYVGNYLDVTRLDMRQERMVVNHRGAQWVRA